MTSYKAEKNADLQFELPESLVWEELDKQGVKLPEHMKFVDLVIERDEEVLLIEVKDPSNSRCPDENRKEYLNNLSNNSILKQELTPKARDSYIFLHLMEKDVKPFKYIVLIGLDAFTPEIQKGLLLNFKDRLFEDIKCEAYEPWKRKHIKDCVVLTTVTWNEKYPEMPVTRLGQLQSEESE